MFEPEEEPRCFVLPVGSAFFPGVLAGLRQRLSGQPPEAMARVQIFVNSRRAERHLTALFLRGPAGFLPRLRVIDDLALETPEGAEIPTPVSPLFRRIELGRMISALLDADPTLAPRTAVFDLADSLANLMDEMHGEGVSPEALERLDLSGHAAHWERSLTFLRILKPFFDDLSEPDHDARQRLVIEALIRDWEARPPKTPVLVAGSTGSRGASAMLMRAVSRLPQGAVILPGFDPHTPLAALLSDEGEISAPDHPQAGLFGFIRSLHLKPADCPQWVDAKVATPARNRLVSLALRPAPVTDHWLREGPHLGGLAEACAGLTLIEARSQRDEALAIALRLRQAADEGQKATLISPDRQLTRQVSAALTRWGILPDDSAGRPLALSPPGVFLRMTAALRHEDARPETLLALLKHPLTHSGGGRNRHLLRSRDLELELLRGGPPEVDFTSIDTWAAARKNDDGALAWARWLRQALAPKAPARALLQDHVTAHEALAQTLADGSGPDAGGNALWQAAAGFEAARIWGTLKDAAVAGGEMSAEEYASILDGALAGGEVRDTVSRHPLIAIWGPREARLSDEGLVILAGLNEGSWPRLPAPDPWLNRQMRKDAGLLLPERQIGLSAHDFQMAVAAETVVLSRALRDAEAPTIASRWVIRLTNLLSGIGHEGEEALAGMRRRGRALIEMARTLETPREILPPAPRPAPRPPLSMRPDHLSVTQIKTLIRDPYAIYARQILRLRALLPLRNKPDALVRGRALHRVMEEFVETAEIPLPQTETGIEPEIRRLLHVAAEVLAADVPWPATRRLWLARLGRISDWFVRGEVGRRALGAPVALERLGRITLPGGRFTLSAKADRIDRTPDGRGIIYDYKTGKPPSKGQIIHFDKQLPLEGAMLQRGAFRDLDPMPVAGLQYIGLGATPELREVEISNGEIDAAWHGLQRLIAAYEHEETGYTARARMEKRTDPSDYDHLSRRGEWDDSDAPVSDVLGDPRDGDRT